MRCAVVGAGGFIGSRLVETMHLGGTVAVRAVVRSLPRAVPLARFDLEVAIADALDETAMRRALDGCEAVVHAVAGPPGTVTGAVAPVYRAANQAGVRRLIYLSSAAVHGQCPPPGTDERAALHTRHAVAYNNAKVRAERELGALRQTGTTEVVILRPSIVYGPRSFWITDWVERLLRGEAAWLDQGAGICNSLYVDNLVHAIGLALTAPGVDGEAFLLGDAETVTWADLYRPLAAAVGVDINQIREGGVPSQARDLRAALEGLRMRQEVQSGLARLPGRVRHALYVLLADEDHRRAGPTTAPRTTLSTEMAALYRCDVKLPHTKAADRLGYAPPVSLAEGLRRTIGWLAFAGYPVATAPTREPVQIIESRV
jgi:2-alkyl-3-oxoalkanoate reductase